MDNKIIAFTNPEFGEVRTLNIENEPWFVAADVCKALDIINSRDAVARLDDDEKNTVVLTDGIPGNPNKTVVNEPGLYTLVLGSRKPEAKAFKRWITHDVIPSIRKNGGYIAGQETLSPEELMAKALLVAQKTIEEKNALLSRTSVELSAAKVENEIMRPKAGYFDEVVDRNLLTNFRETAKELGIKPKSFVNFLIEKKYIYRDKRGKLLPYEDKNDGLFEVKECFNEKTQWAGTQTLVTPKGRETFRLLCQGL
jgi:prophage antirepressor-like protein